MAGKSSGSLWADKPYHLIASPSKTTNKWTEPHLHYASQMAHAHNTLVRGLNAIVQQAPYVTDKNQQDHFNFQDAKDFLFYVLSWTKMVRHYHWSQETVMFPEIDKAAGSPGLVDGSKHEHALFHNGIGKLGRYAADKSPENYRWEGHTGMKSIIDSFADTLTSHLYAEIGVLKSFSYIDGAALRAAFDKTEKVVGEHRTMAMIYDTFPGVLGCSDKTFEGYCDFPPVPAALPLLVKYWFGSRNGAWRFNPCDFKGQPRPLAFGPSVSN